MTLRGRTVRVLAVVAAAVAFVVVGGWSALGWGRGPARPLPPADAPVAQVAAAYFDAALHQDCATTQALTIAQTFAWCTDPTMTSYRDLGAPTLLPKEQASQDLQCVTATITNTASRDGSLNASTRPWSLCFTHTATGWRVVDQGFH